MKIDGIVKTAYKNCDIGGGKYENKSLKKIIKINLSLTLAGKVTN